MAAPGCPCLPGGKESNGLCQEKDENDMYWCLVLFNPVGSCCDGGLYPKLNPLNCKNYSNCRLSGNINNEGAANLDDWDKFFNYTTSYPWLEYCT